MSLSNIKELFSKRVQESVTINRGDDSSKTNSQDSLESVEEEFLSLKEADAGITEYLSECRGFSAVIKQRFSDFHVHEIDCDGNTVYLTNREMPVIEEQPVNEKIISEEIWERLNKLQSNLIDSVEIDVTSFNKDERRDVHRAIKNKFGSQVKSNTVEEGDKKTLVITRGGDSRRDNRWCSDVGKYLHFVLFKKNLDTVDAINILASKLRTKASNLTYAGTKDKRAITSQRISMWHLNAKRLNGVNNVLRDMRVGNYEYKDTQLKLGDLQGNLFEIALRNVEEEDEVIHTALTTLKENGFINYFGLQRFGNSVEVPTHEIGRALIKGDFKTAVELILKPRKGKMGSDLKEARKVWWETRNAERAFSCLRSKDRTIEGKLLMGLAKHGKNAYVNALDSIPRNVRLLYLHAYQSILWNKVLSRRIEKFGKSVIEGDLVCEGDSVKGLSLEDVPKYEIYDIVHPLPGYNITYPDNMIKDWYEELLKEDGLTSESMKQTVRQYSLSGTHRHIVRRVKDLSWDICHYSEPEEDLILSDADKMDSIALRVNQNSDNKYKAVILKFSLDSSTYATMALREVLKIDISTSHQATLNAYSTKRTPEDCGEEPRKRSKV